MYTTVRIHGPTNTNCVNLYCAISSIFIGRLYSICAVWTLNIKTLNLLHYYMKIVENVRPQFKQTMFSLYGMNEIS